MEAASAFDLPARREQALDFGCGVGRLTRALSHYFRECYGVDIAESMIDKARELNASVPGCHFILNERQDLRIFPDNRFDMIYTNVVLMHMPTKAMIKSYIAEFVRILRVDGLLAFQLPSYIPMLHRIQPRRRAYAMLRSVGFGERFLYERLGLFPIRMTYIPQAEVIALLQSHGATVLEARADRHAGSPNQSRTYYVTKRGRPA